MEYEWIALQYFFYSYSICSVSLHWRNALKTLIVIISMLLQKPRYPALRNCDRSYVCYYHPAIIISLTFFSFTINGNFRRIFKRQNANLINLNERTLMIHMKCRSLQQIRICQFILKHTWKATNQDNIFFLFEIIRTNCQKKYI